MAHVIFLVFLVATAVAVLAAPAEGYEPLEPHHGHHLTRRVTCDLLSYGGTVGDSACALKCIFSGKAGGHCESGVCNCRD